MGSSEQVTWEKSYFNGPCPDISGALESEVFVAGALSTMEPFARYHPAYALPFAKRALEALGEWEPSEESI